MNNQFLSNGMKFLEDYERFNNLIYTLLELIQNNNNKMMSNLHNAGMTANLRLTKSERRPIYCIKQQKIIEVLYEYGKL